jgi:hypothetical protein
LHAQTSNNPLAVVDVEVIWRLEVAVEHPFEAVAALHRVGHTFLLAQSSELRQLLVMIRTRLSIQIRSLVLPPRSAQFVVLVDESYGSPTSKSNDERQQ